MNELENLVHVYQVTKTTFANGVPTAHISYVISPPKGKIMHSKGDFINKDARNYPSTDGNITDMVAQRLCERNDPPQVYKLPEGIPACSSEKDPNGKIVTEYIRNGLHPRTRAQLRELIRNIMIDNYQESKQT